MTRSARNSIEPLLAAYRQQLGPVLPPIGISSLLWTSNSLIVQWVAQRGLPRATLRSILEAMAAIPVSELLTAYEHPGSSEDPPTPSEPTPHIQLSFTSTDVTVSGTGFQANLTGIGANAVHLRVVDGNNPTNNTVLPYQSDSSRNFSADLPLSDAAFAGLTVNALGQTVVAFSAYDTRIDPASVPAGGPLTSNTVRVTNILSANRQVVST